MSDNNPTIIKRKRITVVNGHHGGQWKVAYADFVTAMMAFFLLMWLLNATTEEQRKGIADYFAPTLPVSPVSGGGKDALNGDSVLTEDTLSRSALYPADSTPKSREAKAIESSVKEMAKASGLDDADERVRVTVTDEGIVVQLIDAEGKSLFPVGSSTPSPELRVLVKAAASAVAAGGKKIRIVGHTDSRQYQGYAYSNFELSADRANAARRLLIEAGVDDSRLTEITGRADREPITDNPADPANRRIAIVLLDR
ncbi:chemotaxis MotB protein [Parvularcula bermudensis HTCC2503]|uniref:Chemotaxis MotB protein n=1 Tax=Parvularcula bermudensis (strain ATCC BAA-594 / HTCC2503 / KCTC 12087) TaxID=314260 RepID=E0TGK1_PARBH|nr:flagellar motor protein MotB [Parvularcula bermudensis]ADM09620.1 chemotaxis MotB protein [Parvularcula bermudensis HTCC2503]